MRINFSRVFIYIFLIIFLSILFLGLTKDNNYDTENLIGNRIHEFKLNSFHNENRYIINKDFEENNFTLINFFASWCSPCWKEHKYLLKLSKENKKIKILGVNFKDKKVNAVNFLNQLGNPYDLTARDTDGTNSVLFGVYGIPESILINKEQIIIKKFVGPIDEVQYNEIMKTIN
tara:strand:- start:1404 stop:1928 length:525 start_codon:yes stop_codon:yes gene_type:complete